VLKSVIRLNASLAAQQFPDELAACLPPQRQSWQCADARRHIFDMVGPSVAFRLK
jgi:hypothetical protein